MSKCLDCPRCHEKSVPFPTAATSPLDLTALTEESIPSLFQELGRQGTWNDLPQQPCTTLFTDRGLLKKSNNQYEPAPFCGPRDVFQVQPVNAGFKFQSEELPGFLGICSCRDNEPVYRRKVVYKSNNSNSQRVSSLKMKGKPALLLKRYYDCFEMIDGDLAEEHQLHYKLELYWTVFEEERRRTNLDDKHLHRARFAIPVVVGYFRLKRGQSLPAGAAALPLPVGAREAVDVGAGAGQAQDNLLAHRPQQPAAGPRASAAAGTRGRKPKAVKAAQGGAGRKPSKKTRGKTDGAAAGRGAGVANGSGRTLTQQASEGTSMDEEEQEASMQSFADFEDIDVPVPGAAYTGSLDEDQLSAVAHSTGEAVQRATQPSGPLLDTLQNSRIDMPRRPGLEGVSDSTLPVGGGSCDEGEGGSSPSGGDLGGLSPLREEDSDAFGQRGLSMSMPPATGALYGAQPMTFFPGKRRHSIDASDAIGPDGDGCDWDFNSTVFSVTAQAGQAAPYSANGMKRIRMAEDEYDAPSGLGLPSLAGMAGMASGQTASRAGGLYGTGLSLGSVA